MGPQGHVKYRAEEPKQYGIFYKICKKNWETDPVNRVFSAIVLCHTKFFPPAVFEHDKSI